jgi:hypothetical protein
VLVQPLGCIGQINVEPPSGGAILATLEGYIQVLHLMIVAQCQPQVRKHLMLVASRRIEMPQETGMRRNAELAFTRHTKVAKRCNSVWMQMDQLASQIV